MFLYLDLKLLIQLNQYQIKQIMKKNSDINLLLCL